jgi:hypothetical protein
VIDEQHISRIRANPSSSTGQVSHTNRRRLPDHERACRVIALAGDFYVFASRVTTSFSAVLFSIRHIAQARYVRTFFCPFFRHYNSLLPITAARGTLD